MTEKKGRGRERNIYQLHNERHSLGFLLAALPCEMRWKMRHDSSSCVSFPSPPPLLANRIALLILMLILDSVQFQAWVNLDEFVDKEKRRHRMKRGEIKRAVGGREKKMERVKG